MTQDDMSRTDRPPTPEELEAEAEWIEEWAELRELAIEKIGYTGGEE